MTTNPFGKRPGKERLVRKWLIAQCAPAQLRHKSGLPASNPSTELHMWAEEKPQQIRYTALRFVRWRKKHGLK
jgi:hypothetical protein